MARTLALGVVLLASVAVPRDFSALQQQCNKQSRAGEGLKRELSALCNETTSYVHTNKEMAIAQAPPQDI